MLAEDKSPLGVGSLSVEGDALNAYVFVSLERLPPLTTIAFSGQLLFVVATAKRLNDVEQ
jgi:hypothetical protein